MTQTNPFAVPGAFLSPGQRQVAFAVLRRLKTDDSGQDMVEYALVASFMALASVAGVNGLASKIANDMTIVLNGFNAALAGHS